MDTGDADRDQDGYVGLDELYDYVYDHVQRATPNQTPGKWAFDLRGELRVARRARPVTVPVPLPPELQEAIAHPLSGMRAGAVGELQRLLSTRHAGLALAARLALQRLTEDDSRAVGSAAAAALGQPLSTISAPIPTSPTEPVAPSPTPTPIGEVTTGVGVPSPVVPEPVRSTKADKVSPSDSAMQPPSASRVAAGLSVPVRVLTVIAVAALAYGQSAARQYLDTSNYFGRVGFVITIWLWLLAGCSLLVAVAGRRRPERSLSQGLVVGVGASLLAALAEAVALIDASEFRRAFWIVAVGVLVVAFVVIAELVPGHGVRQTVLNAVCAAVTLTALALYMVAYSSFDGQPQSWRTVLSGLVLVLVVGNVTVRVRRWRRSPQTRTALILGAIATALLVFDAVSTLPAGLNAFSAIFIPALLVVLVVDTLIDDSRAVPLAAARLSVILGLLVLQAPTFTESSYGLIPLAAHPFIEVGAAGCALAACYAVADSRSRRAR